MEKISDTTFYKKVRIIDQAITAGVLNPAVLTLIREKPYNDYFFKKADKAEWFKTLEKEGFFSVDKAPSPVPAEEKGYYSIPVWSVLPYLERISHNVDVIDELISIMKNVSTYRDASGEPIDNYVTWDYFVKILLNFPPDRIPLDIINLVPLWLGSKFRTKLQGAEIVRKLTPKLLNSPSAEDWKKAERLIEIMTDIKWAGITEGRNKVTRKKEEAVIAVDPYWLIEFFEESGSSVGEKCSPNLIYVLADRIKAIFKKKYTSKSVGLSYQNKKYLISVVTTSDAYKYEIVLEELLYAEGEESIFPAKSEEVLKFFVSDVDKYNFVSKIKSKLVTEKFPELKNEFDKALGYLYSSAFNDYSYVWFDSLNVLPNDAMFDDAEKALVYILRNILLTKAGVNQNETNKILSKFVSDEYPYPLFKRLVMFIAANHWSAYREHFWALIQEGRALYFDSPYRSELAELLKSNINKFESKEKDLIKKIINDGPLEYNEYWKVYWLSLLKDDHDFRLLYEEQAKLSAIKKEEFIYESGIAVTSGFGKSPLTSEEMISITNEELANKFKEFEKEIRITDINATALAQTLKEAAKTSPNKFIENLDPFINAGFAYVFEIFDGIRDAWNARKNLEFEQLFKFIISYIDRPVFWQDQLITRKDETHTRANHLWIVGIISELIRDGVKRDEWAFPDRYLAEMQKIILVMLSNLKVEDEKEIKDYVNYSLNTACGKALSALIYLALKQDRLKTKGQKETSEKVRWSAEIKDMFNQLLEKNFIEATTDLGGYLPSLYHLDSEWVKDKITYLVDEPDNRKWEAFMTGYLWIGRVYSELYNLMSPHYERGLEYEFKEKHAKEYLIQHIAIGYLRGHESIQNSNSLFGKIIESGNVVQIKEIIRFFWSQNNNLNKSSEEDVEMINRILAFWQFLFQKIKRKGTVNDNDATILSELGKLAVYLPWVDNINAEWLVLSAPYIVQDSYFFLEYLNAIKDKGNRQASAKYIGQIFLKMLENSTPEYDTKHIRSIVEFLYQENNESDADSICNIYGSRQLEFLRDIYDKYSKE